MSKRDTPPSPNPHQRLIDGLMSRKPFNNPAADIEEEHVYDRWEAAFEVYSVFNTDFSDEYVAEIYEVLEDSSDIDGVRGTDIVEAWKIWTNPETYEETGDYIENLEDRLSQLY